MPLHFKGLKKECVPCLHKSVNDAGRDTQVYRLCTVYDQHFNADYLSLYCRHHSPATLHLHANFQLQSFRTTKKYSVTTQPHTN